MTYDQLVDQVKEAYERGQGQPWSIGLTHKQFVTLYHSMDEQLGKPPSYDVNWRCWLVRTNYGVVHVSNGRSKPLQMI